MLNAHPFRCAFFCTEKQSGLVILRCTAKRRTQRFMTECGACCPISGGVIFVFCGQLFQPLLNFPNPLLDITAQTVDDRLVFVFPFLVLGKHSEEQVNIQRRPDPCCCASSRMLVNDASMKLPPSYENAAPSGS